MKKCSLYNYADDNSLSHSAPSVDEILSRRWFKQNGIEANFDIFQFLISWPCPTENIELKISDNVTITSEPCVKTLGMIIDNRLTFTDHINACCTKAARQVNALSRKSKNLDLKWIELIFQSFISSSFTYCQIRHLSGKQNNEKEEKILERPMWILYDESEYNELLVYIKQGSSPCCNLDWIVICSRSSNQYIMQALCVCKTCLKSRNHLSLRSFAYFRLRFRPPPP